MAPFAPPSRRCSRPPTPCSHPPPPPTRPSRHCSASLSGAPRALRRRARASGWLSYVGARMRRARVLASTPLLASSAPSFGCRPPTSGSSCSGIWATRRPASPRRASRARVAASSAAAGRTRPRTRRRPGWSTFAPLCSGRCSALPPSRRVPLFAPNSHPPLLPSSRRASPSQTSPSAAEPRRRWGCSASFSAQLTPTRSRPPPPSSSRTRRQKRRPAPATRSRSGSCSPPPRPPLPPTSTRRLGACGRACSSSAAYCRPQPPPPPPPLPRRPRPAAGTLRSGLCTRSHAWRRCSGATSGR
mmetsp:Transcript_17144/g.56275  ORF Transcript_17144/g.56275 Transcript_17144/m.56275 type:complete len:301 (-) Transcript_17144:270-1172(-)